MLQCDFTFEECRTPEACFQACQKALEAGAYCLLSTTNYPPADSWSNNPKPITVNEILGDAWDAGLGALYPAHLAHLGKQYGFRRAHAWETPHAYRQSLVAFIVIRTAPYGL